MVESASPSRPSGQGSASSPKSVYTADQAARITACARTQLDYWRRAGLVVPDESDCYAFRDLVALRVVRSLLDAGLSASRVRRAIHSLVEAGDDIVELRLVTDGTSVWACRDDGQILDALRKGQLALFVSVGEFANEVGAAVARFNGERSAFVEQLRAADEANVSDAPAASEGATPAATVVSG